MFKKKENYIEKVFDICLDRVLIEGESIEDCIADYPEYSDELKSLLDVSIKTQNAVSSVEARPDFKARLKYILESEMNQANTPKLSSFKWKFQWVPVALSLCIVLLLSGGGTVAAASNSMPDNPLYNVKLASEKAQLLFTFGDEAKANLYSEFVTERVNEIVVMASANNIKAVDKSSEIMQNQLNMIDVISQEKQLATQTPPEGGSVLAITTVTETTWIGSEEINSSDKHTTSTQTTDTVRPAFTTVTITVVKGGEEYQVENEQFVRTPPEYVTNTSNQLLIDTLYNDILILYGAAASNSGLFLESILQAIEVLENSYYVALGNVQ